MASVECWCRGATWLVRRLACSCCRCCMPVRRTHPLEVAAGMLYIFGLPKPEVAGMNQQLVFIDLLISGARWDSVFMLHG